MNHKPETKYKITTTIYKVLCSCGLEFMGLTPNDADEAFQRHLQLSGTKKEAEK